MTAPDTIDTPAMTGCATMAAPKIDEVIATPKLFARKARSPDFKAENEALISLVEVMSQTPDIVLQKLADTALLLCEAGSAGISLVEAEAGKEIFRWRATAGNYAEYLGGTMPRDFSPCGAGLERDAPMLMINMVHYYPYVSALHFSPHEVLLVPFHSNGQPVGTLWVVAHDDSRQFDTEDLRILRSLTNFASVAVQTFARTHELEAASLNAKAASETREQFIAVLGHDLRNPLGAIVNSAKLLERGASPERIVPLGQIIGKSAYRIGELVDNLLDFARGRLGGGIGVSPQVHDTLEPLLDHVVAELRSAYPERIVQTKYAFGAPVEVDADRIGQMVSNLVGNALTHGDPNAPVRLQAHSVDGILMISVSNKGAPIAEETKDRLFKPFERGSSGENGNGLGLGLYICSEIARAHGGELTVTSSDEQTVFQFIMAQGMAPTKLLR